MQKIKCCAKKDELSVSLFNDTKCNFLQYENFEQTLRYFLVHEVSQLIIVRD